MSSVRFICGTQEIHKELEQKIAEFHKMEECILYPSCFDANAGFFEAILTEKDAVISDELNHASIIDGIRLCKAKKFRYKHLDVADLERCLKETQGNRLRIIVTDGVFSMVISSRAAYKIIVQYIYIRMEISLLFRKLSNWLNSIMPSPLWTNATLQVSL